MSVAVEVRVLRKRKEKNTMKTSEKGLAIIKKFESCRLSAYYDPIGIPTIGWGHTAGVRMGQAITQAQADAYLAQDVGTAEREVSGYDGTYHWNQNQFDALVSFTFNCGAGNLDKLLADGRRTVKEVSAKLPSYCKADGKILPGLVRRRSEEKALFDTPVEYYRPMPSEPSLWDAEAVGSLQEALNADGIRDSNGKMLKVDGIKGSMTSAAVEKVLLKAVLFDTSCGRYGVGSTGQVVKWLQMRLNTVIGDSIVELLGSGLEADGKLGADTRMAVGLFQGIRGLKQDYVAGPRTVTELLRA